MKKLTQGTKVKFHIGDFKGTGKVVGLSINEQPIIGVGYIIEPDESIENDTYPYSHFICFAIYLKEI